MALARKSRRPLAGDRRGDPRLWAGTARALARMGVCPMEMAAMTGMPLAEAQALSLVSGRIADVEAALTVRPVSRQKSRLALHDGGAVITLREGVDYHMQAIRDRLIDARKRKARDCLRCGVRFLSEHAGHRHCGDCRGDLRDIDGGQRDDA